MKKYYITLITLLLTGFIFSQSYNLGIVHVSNYDFKVVAIPDFTSSGNTDISDVGFTLVLPSGSVDVANATVALAGRTVNVQEFDAAFLTGLNLGNGTKDVFQFNMPPGQTLLAHSSGDQIDLFNFQITNMPTTDEMYFLLNSDPIAMGAGGVLESFYNSNIDNTSTQDYFSIPEPDLDSFMFDTLSVGNIEVTALNIKIYPNPTSNQITVDTTYEIESVKLYNILGELVLTTSNQKSITVRHLNSGVYLLKISLDNKDVIKRIIIE
ncbi:T9SS type A sorting domain-containing protein [uncultured Psychroserpens sp.]|uniref:T9SS type A sorting domain-containing protein n=1 Tax=uncultured Psychroserpens sp. TaxID=255436 RepID=UPI00261A224C|nr:T9SS type A sorting domain-containing protein [uncultured Psychroserpens sp.]